MGAVRAVCGCLTREVLPKAKGQPAVLRLCLSRHSIRIPPMPCRSLPSSARTIRRTLPTS